MSRWAAILWFGASAVFLLVGVNGTWETGRPDIWQPGPHVSTSGWEEGAWPLLIAVGVVAAALAAHGRLNGRRGAWVLAVLALLAGGFMVLMTVAWISYTPVGCGAWFVPECAAGEDAIVKNGWGAYASLAASISLTLAMVAILLQRFDARCEPRR